MNQKKTVIISFTIVFLLFASCIAYFFIDAKKIPSNPDGTIGNTAGNLYNDGLFCESNGMIYFANSYDNNCMYVMDLTESTCEKLSSSAARQILAGEDYLFYSQLPVDEASANPIYSNANGFVRMTKNGTQITRFHDNYIFYMQLVNDTIFYLSSTEAGPEFYRVSTSSTDNILLSNTSINPACVYNNLIYYNDISITHDLYTLNTANDVSTAYLNINMWYPIINENYIYYLDVENNYKLARYDLATQTSEILTEDRVDCYNLVNGTIYYQKNSTDEPALKKMLLDGSSVEVLLEGNYTNINVTSTYVYFQEFGDSITTYRTPSSGPSSITNFSYALNSVVSDD